MSLQQQEIAAEEQPAERPRDRFRRYLINEVTSYEIALSITPTLGLTKWRLDVANEMLDLFDLMELKEMKAKIKQQQQAQWRDRR